MEANELMKGDLVRVTNGIAKVHDIGKIIGVEFIDGGYDVFKIEELEPIPLERIHLIKNGFRVREDTDDTEYYYYDGYRINVDFYEGLPEDDIPPTVFLSIDFAEKDIVMPIEYVHELQQAMRIMGCNKEIEL